MGNNLYLHLQTTPCATCGKPDIEESRIHIGKSSGGWVFLWRGYQGEFSPPMRDIEAPVDWYEYLAQEIQNGGEIRDEYDKPWTLSELINFVIAKRTRLGANLRHSDGQHSLDRPIVPSGGDDIAFHEFS
jgi:hypothetical protein